MNTSNTGDVIKATEVPKATVALVVNGQKKIFVKKTTREQFINEAIELLYVQNQWSACLRSKKPFYTLITIPDISNPFFPKVMKLALRT